jgi:hypothetical protein
MKSLLSLLFVLIMFGTCCSAQTFNCYIANDHLISTTEYEFDVFLQSTDTVFNFRTFQGCFTFDPAFIFIGTDINVSFVPGSSQLVNYVPGAFLWSPMAPGFMVSPNIGVSCPNGTLITTTSAVRVATYHMTITNGNVFHCAPSKPNMVVGIDPAPSGLALKMSISKWNSIDCTIILSTNISNSGTYTHSSTNTLYSNVNNMRPVITSQPVSTGTCIAGVASFLINATGNIAASGPVIYQWFENGIPLSDGTTANGTYYGSTTATLSISNPSTMINGYLYSCIVSQCNTDTSSDAMLSIGSQVSSSLLGNDTAVASGSTLTLDGGGGFITYLWSTNETTQTIDVQTTGTYWVSVTDPLGCILIDTIDITFLNGLNNIVSENDFIIFPTPAKNNLFISNEKKIIKENL